MSTVSPLRRWLSAVAAATIGLAPLPTLASSTASASLSGLTWTLFDLDPDDGIAPGISFAAPGDYYGNFASAWVSNSAGSFVNDYQTSSPSVLASGSLPAFGVSASGSVTTPGATPASLSLLSSGSANNLVPEVTGSFSASSGSQFWQFTLTANTLVTFRANVAVSATTTGLGYQDASASARLSAWDNYFSETLASVGTLSEGGTSSQQVSTERRVSVFAYEGGSDTNSGRLAVTFTNGSTDPTDGYLRAETYVNGYSGVTPVPEPHTWAMLIAGVALLGGVALRRSRA